MSYVSIKPGINIRATNGLNDIAIIAAGNGGYYEFFELNFVITMFSEGGIFFDVGANSGLYSIAVTKFCHNTKAYAFEPVPITCTEFKHNIDLNGVSNRVELIEKAVGSSCGKTYITSNLYSSNYLTSAESPMAKLQVEGITIDSFVEAKKIDGIKLIKIDVEGLELSALKGALNTIKTQKPTLLVEIIEDHPGFYDRKHESVTEILELMTNLGYHHNVVCEDSFGRKPNCEMTYHNYVFYLDQ